MPTCPWCRGNGFTFMSHRGGWGAAPCGCLPLEVRRRFEENIPERVAILRQYAVTEDAIAIVNAPTVKAEPS
jgi:hypothetical protein